MRIRRVAAAGLIGALCASPVMPALADVPTRASAAAASAFAVGARGQHIAAMQSALIARGYSIPAGPTGLFGSQTRAAVAAFQRAQGWSAAGSDGIPGPLTLARLGLSAVAAPAPAAPAPTTGYAPGVQGPHISALQSALIARGYRITDGTTGVFGSETRSAVAAFQRAQGWSAAGSDGIPGPLTLARLGLSAGAAPAPAPPVAPTNVALTPAAFVARYASAADHLQRTYGVPSLVALSQAALESGWGARSPGYNFFGIKARPSDPASAQQPRTTVEILASPPAPGTMDVASIVALPDGRYSVTVRQWFRVYPTAWDGFLDYGRLLATNPRYRPAFAETGDPYRFAAAVAAAGYATDPGYVAKLHKVMDVVRAAGGR